MNKEHYINAYLNFTPQFDHYYFNDKKILAEPEDVSIESKKLFNSLNNSALYELFLKQKSRRPNQDIYACFQPFNESTKALFPFLKQLKKDLKPNDIILNLWDRSGWLTTLLCGLFPDQKIITTWEGDRDVLGYKGYHFWMKSYSNLEILFHNPEKPLPLNSDSISCSIGLDLLHRFDQTLTLNELNRVVKPSGCILFPHVHLSNSEPDPYFDRGGIQLHGNTYNEVITTITKSKNRIPYVFSEPQMFSENDIKRSSNIPLVTNPNTADYNGLIAILPNSWSKKSLSFYSIDDIEHLNPCHIIVNNLLDINLHNQTVSINRNNIEGQLGYLLDRHPIYLERIKTLDGYKLSELATQILYLAQHAYSVEEISKSISYPTNAIIVELRELEQKGLLQVLPISKEGTRLQYYLMTQQYILTNKEQAFPHFWKKTIEHYSSNVAIHSLQDESEFTYQDCDEIVQAIGLKLQANGFVKGDRILICAKIHSESILLLWACLNLGIVVVPINADLPVTQIEYITNAVQPKLKFFSESVFKDELSTDNIPFVIFDEDENLTNHLYFSDWIDQVGNETNLNIPHVSKTDQAIILFTSGSTGLPKGVELSHGNLIRSGRLITESFQWNENDKFYNIGTLNTMSGIRNSSISSLHVGSSVIIPQESTLENIIAISESVNKTKATILGSNPTLLRQLVNYKTKIKGQINSIRLVICTGNALKDNLRDAFLSHYDLPIYNYYGLTETTGICAVQSANTKFELTNNIGSPIDCIAQVVDDNNNVLQLGQTGELRVFSQNLMDGYLNNIELTDSTIKNGWFYTNDLVHYTKEGHIKLIGRKKVIIKTKSEELIHLSEIKNFIEQLSTVQDSFIHPIKKGDLEHFVAFIAPKEAHVSDDKLIKSIKSSIVTKLGKHKVPDHFIILPELPYTFDGKIALQPLLKQLHEL